MASKIGLNFDHFAEIGQIVIILFKFNVLMVIFWVVKWGRIFPALE
jgi:hypothetical protein